jgi:hypothetical protein
METAKISKLGALSSSTLFPVVGLHFSKCESHKLEWGKAPLLELSQKHFEYTKTQMLCTRIHNFFCFCVFVYGDLLTQMIHLM